jgi:hypothetical protein
MFKALVLREVNEGKVESRVETLSETVLPEGDVTVAVEHSTLRANWHYRKADCLRGLRRKLMYEGAPVGTISQAQTDIDVKMTQEWEDNFALDFSLIPGVKTSKAEPTPPQPPHSN